MPHKPISGIYVITCIPTEKVYVGSAASIKLRWCEHKYTLKRGNHHSQRLQNAWNKYGPDAFSWTIVEVVPHTELTAREQFHMDALRACDKARGFNLFPYARRTEGYKHSEATRAKIRAAKQGMTLSPEHAEALHAATRGKKQTPEFIEKRIAANRGKKRTLEQRAAQSARMKGKRPSPETIAKLREANRGYLVSDETRTKISASLRGKPKTEEHRAKLRAANIGKSPSDETRAKLSAERVRRYKSNEARAKIGAASRESWQRRKAEAARLKAEQRAQATFLRTGIKPAAPENPKRETQGKLFD